MSLASTDIQRALEDALDDWTATPAIAAAPRDAANGDTGGAAARWAQLAELGMFDLPVPEARGGAGGTLADLAVALERTGRALVPGVFLPTAAVAFLLGAADTTAEADAALAALAAGTRQAAIALDSSATLTAGPPGDPATLRGSAGLVLGGAEAELLLLSASGRHYLVDTAAPGVAVTPRDGLDLTRSLAEIELDGVTPLVEVTGLPDGFIRDVYVSALTAEAAGIAGWCLRTAVEYAKIREQFDRPIGSFQAVQHLCAEMAIAEQTVLSAAWDAADAAGYVAKTADGAAQFSLAASAAGLCGLDAAVEIAEACIQVHGGVGYTWEHEAHLYLRRALVSRLIAGSSESYRRVLGEAVLAGSRRRHPVLSGGMDPAAQARLSAFVAETAASPPAGHRARLVDAGYLVPGWPAPYGLSADASSQLAIATELRAAGIDVPDLVIGAWTVRAIADHGTPEQCERFVWPTLRGEMQWCQLFSEPGAGSDLASLRLAATRVEGGWSLKGQKVWTSLAREADWGLCLARTDPTAPKRRGITVFLVDMRSHGLDVRPLREATGEARFNEVFFDDVFVPDDLVVGTVDDGWRVATSALATERMAMGSRPLVTAAMGRILEVLGSDPGAAAQWLSTAGELFGRAIVNEATEQRSAAAGLAGAEQGALPLVTKLVGVRLAQDERRTSLLVLGARGAIDGGGEDEYVRDYFRSRALSIAGGSSQILLTMLAERVLGLPRGR